MFRFSSARTMMMAIALALGSFGAVTAAHADYYYHGHRYHHHQWVRDHYHPNGYYRYY